jgi:hypothetical protein
MAAVECSRVRVERAEVELYVAELLAARERLDRPSLLACRSPVLAPGHRGSPVSLGG